jgi:hypothetical protein
VHRHPLRKPGRRARQRSELTSNALVIALSYIFKKLSKLIAERIESFINCDFLLRSYVMSTYMSYLKIIERSHAPI